MRFLALQRPKTPFFCTKGTKIVFFAMKKSTQNEKFDKSPT